MVSLDLSRVTENATLISVLMTCASAWMESALLDPRGGQRWVVYDEAWRLMSHPALLRRMDAHWRLARHYGIANMLIFHKLSDLDNVGDQGSAMRALASSLLANAETRVVYRQESDQLGSTAAALGLTGTEQSLLPTLGTGQGLWRIKHRSFVVQHQLHPAELELFDTTGRMTGALTRTCLPSDRRQPMRVRSATCDREAKLEALQQKLTEAVGALVTGEDWRRALEFAARFRSRSFNNTMLIYVQHYAAYQQGRVPEPTPTYVAGFKQWLSLDRHVMKGQSGYAILAPVTARFASSTPEATDSWRRLARGEKPAPARGGPVPDGRAASPRTSGTSRRPTETRSPSARARSCCRVRRPRVCGTGWRTRSQRAGSSCGWSPHARAIGGANGLTDYIDPRGVGADGHGRRRPGQDAGPRARPRDAPRPRQRRRRDCTAGSPRSKPRASPSWSAPRTGWTPAPTRSRTSSSWAASVPGKNPVEVVQATADRVRGAAVTVLDNLDTPQVGDGDPPGLDREAARAGRVASRRDGRAPTGLEPSRPRRSATVSTSASRDACPS